MEIKMKIIEVETKWGGYYVVVFMENNIETLV